MRYQVLMMECRIYRHNVLGEKSDRIDGGGDGIREYLREGPVRRVGIYGGVSSQKDV